MAKNSTAKNLTNNAPLNLGDGDTDDTEPTGSSAPAASASTALVKHAGGALVVAQEGLDINMSDVVVPRVHIVHPGSNETETEGATKGCFRDNLGYERTELHFALLRVRKSMVRWDKEIDNTKPLCKSNNARQPAQEIAQPYCEECMREVKGRDVPICPEAKWDGKSKPRCAFMYAIAAWDLDGDTPFLLALKRTALQAARAMLTRVLLKKGRAHHVEIRMGLTMRTEPKAYYVPVVKSVERITEADRLAVLDEAFEASAAFDLDVTQFDEEPDVENGTNGASDESDTVPF